MMELIFVWAIRIFPENLHPFSDSHIFNRLIQKDKLRSLDLPEVE